MSPIEWTEFVFKCRGCHRLTRLDKRTLLEQNAVDAALGRERPLEETARRFDYCEGCNSGRSMPGEHDVPPGAPVVEPLTEWEVAMDEGRWPPKLPE